MSEKLKNIGKIKMPQARTEFEEFGKAKGGLVICRDCNNYYFKKSWHHDADGYIAKREGKDIPVTFSRCPACSMIKSRQFEGIVTIENIPLRLRQEVENLIRSYSRKATLRDPQDRLIDLKKGKNTFTATFTENQLAVKVAKKIRDSFQKVRLTIQYSGEPSDTASAKVVFPDQPARRGK